MYTEFEDYLRDELRLAPRTVKEYVRSLRFLIEDCGFDPRGRAAESVAEWVSKSTADVSAPTHNLYVTTLRHFQNFLKGKGEAQDFASKLLMRKKPRRLPKPLEFKDVYALIAKTPEDSVIDLRDKAVLHILYCGLRNEEVTNLTKGCFTENDDGTGMLRVIGKGDKERVVPVNAAATDAIKKYMTTAYGAKSFAELELQPEVPLFVTAERQKLSTRQVRQIVYDAAERAAVDGAYPHRLRHSFATHLLDFGVTDMFALRDVMGHSKLETTQQYVLVSSQAKRDRINKFHPMQLGVEP